MNGGGDKGPRGIDMPLSWVVDIALHDKFNVVEVLDGSMFGNLEDFAGYAVD